MLRGADSQLRALVDVCHIYGMAVLFDVVYNDGGFEDHAFQPNVPNTLLNDPAFKNLQSLLKKSTISKDAARSAATRNKAVVENAK